MSKVHSELSIEAFKTGFNLRNSAYFPHPNLNPVGFCLSDFDILFIMHFSALFLRYSIKAVFTLSPEFLDPP